MEPIFDFLFSGNFKEQFDRFDQITPCLFHRIALTGNVQIWTERNVSVPFTMNQGG